MSTNVNEPCKCCYGTGVQTNKDGLRIKCPCCGGTGKWQTNKFDVMWRER